MMLLAFQSIIFQAFARVALQFGTLSVHVTSIGRSVLHTWRGGGFPMKLVNQFEYFGGAEVPKISEQQRTSDIRHKFV